MKLIKRIKRKTVIDEIKDGLMSINLVYDKYHHDKDIVGYQKNQLLRLLDKVENRKVIQCENQQ